MSFARSGYWVFGRANTLEALAGESGGSRGKPRGITHPWSEVERAKRSEGLHKRSAEAWGDGLPPRGAAPISRKHWGRFAPPFALEGWFVSLRVSAILSRCGSQSDQAIDFDLGYGGGHFHFDRPLVQGGFHFAGVLLINQLALHVERS